MRNAWQEMRAKSWDPRRWFESSLPPGLNDPEQQGCTIMWVYYLKDGVYVVGYYSPDREFHVESTFPERVEAVERVHFLNGGGRSRIGV